MVRLEFFGLCPKISVLPLLAHEHAKNPRVQPTSPRPLQCKHKCESAMASHVASHGRPRFIFFGTIDVGFFGWFLLLKYGCPWCHDRFFTGTTPGKIFLRFSTWKVTGRKKCFITTTDMWRDWQLPCGECENHHDNIVCPVCFVDISPPHGLIPRFKAAAHCKSAANAMCTACALMLVLATVLSVKKPAPSPIETRTSLIFYPPAD